MKYGETTGKLNLSPINFMAIFFGNNWGKKTGSIQFSVTVFVLAMLFRHGERAVG